MPWFADADGDGFGDPDAELMACWQPAGFVEDDQDCDDGDDGVFPWAGDEYGDAIDGDCDGQTHCAATSVGGSYYATCLFPDASWDEALEACHEAGYDSLASIPDALVDGVLTDLASPLTAEAHNIWIGATDEVVDGTWEWLDGTPWSYEDWSEDEPYAGDNGVDYGIKGVNAPGYTWGDATVSGAGFTIRGYACSRAEF